MALAYKLLKTITIDGETMGLDVDWGGLQSNRKDIALAANTETEGALLTITEPGLYLFTGRVAFSRATTTGTRLCMALLYTTNNGAAAQRSIYQTISGMGQDEASLLVTRMIAFNQNQVPANVAIRAMCSKACPSGYTGLYCSKLVKMGGVIQHLKNLANLICCRPLTFGKAVA